ncbi:glutamine amidotransferase-related protein, partial [Enterococcus cecorum]|uniref:glutamine amidotransferase-related protein n=1 Tax=Enterococcus cecorum TaxID=44008 RepID=UPI0032D4645B
RQLSRMNCNTIIVPYTATFQEIKNLCPDGVLLSNGPGNPYTLEDSFETIRQIQANYPTFAIANN